MPKNYNSMSFTPDEVEAGLMQELLNFLTKFSKTAGHRFVDIHIWYDSYCFIVEWVIRPYDESYGGAFKYVGEDEYIMKDESVESKNE